MLGPGHQHGVVPSGTAEIIFDPSLRDLAEKGSQFPALKRWAIVIIQQGLCTSRHQHRRPMNLAAAQLVQRLIGFLQRELFDARLNGDLRGYCEELLSVPAR